MPLRFLLLAGHLADYVAKLALLLRLAREPSLRAHFIALAVVHVAANVHGAYAVIRGCGLPRFAVLPIVLVFGVVTPLLQVLLLFDAVLALRTRSQGAGFRAGGRALHLPLAPLDVVLEGSVFVLATLHIHFSRVLGRVDLLSETHSDDVGGLDLLPGMPGWPGLPGNHAFLGSQVFEALLVFAMVTSLANATSGFVLWDASVSLKVSRAMFLGYRGKCALLAHVVLRGNEVAGRAALLAILAVVLRPCYAASYLAASYVAHILVLLLAGSPTSAWESAILAWPILFANLPQFVDSPKHGAAAQSVASLVCGLRALELAMAASATTAIVLLESAVDDWGEEGLLEVIDALRTLCHRRALLGLGLCLLLHYLCMLARWCGGQPEAAACGEGGASLESSPTGTRRGSPGATSVMRTSGSDSDLGDEKAFWPPALGVSQLLWGAACQRAVTIPQFIGSHGWRMSMGTGPGPPPRGGHPGGGVSGGALRSSVGGAVSSTRRPLEELNQPRLQDFDMIRIIGCGEFGQVCQVRWRATQETFAMKRLSKLEYARRRISDNAKREVATLRAASGHPFVVELFFAIESVSEWAIVMEYCPLGDLQQVLLSEGCPGLELARILKISAELTLALEHLHERGIAFRDLKLENVVVGQDGHVKLTDFGLAKQQEGGPDAISEAHEHGGVYAAFTRTFCDDPVHGTVLLPKLLKKFIDHRYFQRLRFIKQLGMCSHVYPGATHSRFFHSIGTAYLSFSLMKSVRERQPELSISDKDIMCVTLAGLLHDLGHPCFSHMFEVFVRRAGAKKPGLTEEERARYADWNHEQASIALVRLLWSQLQADLTAAGLSEEDLEFVCLVIDPPKKRLQEAMEGQRLHEAWVQLITCRPPEKSWMFEIVSNWRSGIDTDKFDYFRRDAYHLGIRKEFDHWRYIASVRAVFDERCGVWTLSPPDKDRELLREDMLELRRSLHRKAYQHKTTQKLEQHMVDILELMENGGLKVVGGGGRERSLSEAAVDFDADAYVQLIDSFVESKLYEFQAPTSPLRVAYEEYERRIILRHMFRLLADFDVPADVDFTIFSSEEIIDNLLQTYHRLYGDSEEGRVASDNGQLNPKLFRCHVAEFHIGMKRKNPLEYVLFHSSRDPSNCNFLRPSEITPALTQKVFLFYDGGRDAHGGVLFRQLVESFSQWAKEVQSKIASVQHSPPPSTPIVSPARLEHTPQRKRRRLSLQSSCPFDPFDGDAELIRCADNEAEDS